MKQTIAILKWPTSAGALFAVIAVIAVITGIGCERSGNEALPENPAATQQTHLLSFPAWVRAEDDTVNTFIEAVIESCASGDYDRFRTLWVGDKDPIPREQFHGAWRSVRKVEIVALHAMRDPRTSDVVYGAFARVMLDPRAREPQRDVVLLIVLENDQWRITEPPETLTAEFLLSLEDKPKDAPPAADSTPSESTPSDSALSDSIPGD